MAAAESEPGPAPPAEEASITATEKPREETALDPIVQCIIVRKDLDWPTGAVMAQACHASVAALEDSKDDEHTVAYLAATNLAFMHKVVYEAKSAAALEAMAAKLTARGAVHHMWREQPEDICTAIALKPYPRTLARTFCKGLRLFK